MNNFALLALLGLIAYGIVKTAKAAGSDKAARHCMSCGADVQPVRSVRGNILIELVLWLCFIIPGLIYSLWRLNSAQKVCPSCGAATLVPMQSPAAVAHRKALQP